MSKALRELLKAWRDYQGSGTPYGHNFEGFMEWLLEKSFDE